MQLRKRTRAALETNIHSICGDIYQQSTSTAESNVSGNNLWGEIKAECLNAI